MHWFLPESTYKSYGQQVKKSVDKTLESEFGLSVFSFMMLHYFFSDSVKPGPFENHWYVTVHFAIYLYVFYNLNLVRLQTTIEIVELYTRQHAGYIVEKS